MIGPNKSYLTMVEEQFKPETVISSSPLRPSNAGLCERELFLLYKAWKEQTPHPDPADVRLQRIFDLGHAIEAEVIRQFQAVPDLKVMYMQQVVDHGLIPGATQLLEGSLDWCLISETHRVIMDAKSRKDKSWNGWDKDVASLSQFGTIVDGNCIFIEDVENFVKNSGDASLVKNVIQLNVYATSKFCRDRNIDHASIVRYNKNDSKWLEVRFIPSLPLLQSVVDKFARVASAKTMDECGPGCVPGSFNQTYCKACKGTQYAPIPQQFKAVSLPSSAVEEEKTILSVEALPADLAYAATAEALRLSSAESPLLKYCIEKRIPQILIDSNTVLAVKYLKSPKPHYEFRVEPNNSK